MRTNGSTLILNDVRHVPDIHLNLISTGKLDDEGYCNTFSGGEWKLSRGPFIYAWGNKSSSLYLMDATVSKYMVNVMEDDKMTELWHRRLSHMSEKGLDCLGKKNVLSSFKRAKLNKCDHCLAGKQMRVSFHSRPPSRKQDLLELVHSDVCGPMKVKSYGGALYFVTFIDYHLRKVWVYALKTKDQVLDTFKQFQAVVERQTGKKLKCIRSDNGGEYIGPFDEYCRSQGIRHQKTPPKTPQLNGLAERMNRTLVERVRCLLSESKLPKSFWGETLYTVAHVINLSPTVSLDGAVPDSVWFGRDVLYDHLRVFGCKAFVHVPNDERSKLDSKTRQCVFVGYGQDEFGYRLYDPVEKKLVRSRDVIFVENQTIEDIGKADKQIDQSGEELVSPEPVPSSHEPSLEAQSDVPIDVHLENEADDDGFDIPIDGNVDDQQHVPEIPPAAPLHRSDRDRQPSKRYSSDQYVFLTDGGEPDCFEEAIDSEHKQQWLSAMKEEMKSLHDNATFELTTLPKDK